MTWTDLADSLGTFLLPAGATPMGIGVEAPSVAVLGSSLLLFGGGGSDGYNNEFYRLDVAQVPALESAIPRCVCVARADARASPLPRAPVDSDARGGRRKCGTTSGARCTERCRQRGNTSGWRRWGR
eukprot:3187118-Rhodomonas_salina.4